MTDYTPKPEHKFTFGLWTVGNIGRDPFGEPVRKALSPVELVHLLAEVNAYGVNLHDNDLVPINATPAERDKIVSDFKRALEETGLVVPMATTNLFGDPAFKDGAFTSNDPKVRAFALQKTMNAIDLGVELGAGIYVFWGGREGVETDAAKDPLTAIKRSREAMNYLCEYVLDQGYEDVSSVTKDLRTGRVQFVFGSGIGFARLRTGRLGGSHRAEHMDVQPVVAIGMPGDREASGNRKPGCHPGPCTLL